MDSSDRITLQDLKETRRVVARMRMRSVLAAGAGGILFSVLLAMLLLWRNPLESDAAVLVAGLSWLLFGLPLLVHWLRHWRKIQSRLRAVEEQVKSGEVVYGSQVQF